MPTNIHRSPYHIFTILLLITALLFITGCSKEEKLPEAIHACQIFSDDEVNTLFDPTVERPPREMFKENETYGTWMSSCNYYSPKTNLSAGIMLQPFFPHSKDAESAYNNFVKGMKSNLSDYNPDLIKDVGEMALWNDQLGQLTFFQGKQMVIVSIMQKGKTPEEKLGFCKKIAQALIDKKILD